MGKKFNKKKRKISKISIILITFVWVVVMIFTLILVANSISNSNKLKGIKSKIKIPDGFYYVGGDIDSGVVISDNKKDEFKGTEYKYLSKLKGNQFVWIPVEKAVVESFEDAEKLVDVGKNPIAIKEGENYKALSYVFDSHQIKYLVVNQSEYNAEPYIVRGSIYGDSEDYIEGSTGDLYQKSFNKMVEQVEKNKGFYISRFEIGNLNKAVKDNEKVVSKAGKEDITYQSWIDLYKVLKRMYDRNDITTEMIWGCQWDAVLVWFARNPKVYTNVYNSNNIGNYYNKLEKTGSNSNYCINNIYDMAGNAFEWTQRGSVIGGRKAYGGCYKTNDVYSLEKTEVYGITYLWHEVGTRMTMYVN